MNGAPETDEQRAWVAVLAVGEPVALGGLTAAWRHGLVADAPALPKVVVPATRVPRTAVADVRRVGWSRLALTEVDGLPVVSARDAIATSAVDAEWSDLLLMLQKAVYAGRTTPAEVLGECRRGLPGSLRLRSAVTAYLLGHDSPPEHEVFGSLASAGLRPDHCNVILETSDGRRTTAVDGYYARGVAYDYRGRGPHGSRRAQERDGFKHASVTAVGATLVPLDARDRRDRARLRRRVRDALRSRTSLPPGLTVVHLPGRGCVCGYAGQ
ncbi:MAG: hypothetical protein ABR520_07085 [Mycobacteriales bacterium]